MSLPWLKNVTFSNRGVRSRNNPNMLWRLDHPGNSGGDSVCPVFQGLWEIEQQNLIACMSVCYKPSILSA